jgi:serine/threonine protein kinase/tetratricopeptide (TPR) repeat protein
MTDAIDDDPVDSAATTAAADGSVGSLGSLLREVARTGPGEVDLAPGTLIAGQYRLGQPLGRGGMGVVYEASDERLHRTVAIKVGAARSASALARLEREAAALAKLAHPNVVVVHQVGEHDGRVFLAMEYVGGGTARTWLARQPRTWRAIVLLYAAAGDGLAAAHAAGLIHRDFKPDNLLVGDDDRPRVADFGLVRAILDDDGALTAASDGAPAPTLTATRAGAIVGTPAYMPPEQLAGADLDARADQFAFCASLWEALYGARPFAGDTPEQVRAAISSSPPAVGDERRRIRGVPRHVVAALRRGLRAERDARWPDLATLVRELRRDPGAARRRLAWVGGGAALAAAIAVPLTLSAQRGPAPCGDGPTLIAAVWSPTRAAPLRKLLASEWSSLAPRLDAYARAWATSHRDACRATRVARSQSEDLLDRRMRCLARARTQLDAVLTALATPGAEARAGALGALELLPDLTVCADVAALAKEVAPPADPAARARVDLAERLLATARAAELDRGHLDPVGKGQRAVEAARASGWAPVVARALTTHGNIAAEAGDDTAGLAAFREAATLALGAGADGAAAYALADLASGLALEDRPGEAALALDLARALAAGTGDRYVVRRAESASVTVASRASRHDDALATLRELIAQTARDPDAPPSWPASDQYNLAAELANAGRYQEAASAAERAVALGVAHWGFRHPTVARYRVLAAMAHENLGQLDQAIALGDRALADLGAWYGPEDHRLLDVLGSVGFARIKRGDPAGVVQLERGLEIARKLDDADQIARLLNRLGIAYVGMGQLDRAAETGAEIVRRIEAADGPNDGDLIDPLLMVGYVAREQGRLEDSRAAFLRALAIGQATVGDDHPGVHNLRVELAKTHLAAGRTAEARALLAPRAAALAPRTDLDLLIVVETHAILAEAQWRLGQRAAARATAAVARRIAASAPDRPDLAAVVAEWSTRHPE